MTALLDGAIGAWEESSGCRRLPHESAVEAMLWWCTVLRERAVGAGESSWNWKFLLKESVGACEKSLT